MNNTIKIYRVSIAMQWFCLAVLVLLPISLVWGWLNFEEYAPRLAAERGYLLDMDYIGPLQLVLGLICSFIPVAILLYGVWRLRLLFGLYRRHIFFSVDNIRHLYIFSLTLFVSALSAPLVDAVLSVVLTFANPPGQKALSLHFGSAEVSTLFIAGALMTISWIMREAHGLAKENAEFV